MRMTRNAILIAACLMTGVAAAQNTAQPLNLQLPPSDMPVAASTAGSHPSSHGQPARDANGNPTSPPGVYYGDHGSGMAQTGERVAAQRCDDSTYNKPQMHGSASMGVMGGNHMSGSYEAATINMTKNLGDCEHPSGGIGLSIHVSQGQFNGRRW